MKMQIDYSELDDINLKKGLIEAVSIDNSLLVQSSNTFFSYFPMLNSKLKSYEYTSYFKAIDQLTRLNMLDKDAFDRLYKGNVYLNLAYWAFIDENYDSAVFFLDAAATEDQIKFAEKPSPARGCLTLDDSFKDNRTISLTSLMLGSNYFPFFIEMYNKGLGSKAINIEHIRKCFLNRAFSDRPEWRPLITAWFTFFLNIIITMRYRDLVSSSDNVDYQFIYLFRGCLLFESLLKSEPSGKLVSLKTLGGLFNNKLKNVEIKQIRDKLFGVGAQFGALPESFSQLINNIGSYTGIKGCMRLTYELRNLVSHNLVWDCSMSYEQLVSFIVAVSTSCLHVLSVLYCDQNE
jgi:hypothetical protein